MIRVGPAGWSYPDWDATVYPTSKPPGFHALAHLARYFDCIEVNSTFYAQPRSEHSSRWVQLVAEHAAFRFTVKLNSAFTHNASTRARSADRPSPGPNDDSARTTRSPAQHHEADDGERARSEARVLLAAEFSRGIAPLVHARRLSAVLVQFPISFLFGRDEVRRLGVIRSVFADLPLVLEVRHQSWFTPPALDTVRGLSFSLAYPDLPAAWNHPPAWHSPTGPIGYLRLHGRNSASWFRREATRDSKYDYLYEPAELQQLAQKAKRLADEHREVIVITNNHFEGKAVANALELLAALRGVSVAAPAQIVETYPRLKSVTHVEGQQRLF